MILPLFLCLMLFLGGVSLWLSKSSYKAHSATDFFLMGRKLGLFGLTMTLLATQIGGGALLGAAEEAYTHGWRVIFYPLGMVLGLIILGLGYGAKMRKLQLTTIAEIFEKVYGSFRLRKAASMISIFSLFLILVGQAIAARKFFISLNFHGDLLFIIFWIILIIYTAKGGLSAAVKTEVFQVSFIIITLLFSCLFALKTPSINSGLTHSHFSATPWLSWLLLPLLFMLIEQDMGQWCFAAKNPRTVSIAALIAACVFMLIACIPIFFGTMAFHSHLQIENGSSVLIRAVNAMTNPSIATFITCAVLMAIISTANALLCSVSSNIVCDFPKAGHSITLSKVIILLIGASTLLFAFLFHEVVAILMFSYGIAVSALFVPVTMAIWIKNPKKSSASLSMSVGICSFVILQLWSFPFPKELISLGCSMMVFILHHSLNKKLKLS